MTIQLSPEAEAIIRELVERGDYSDPGAAIDEALRVLAERDQYARLKAAIAVRHGTVRAGGDDPLDSGLL